jgi:hypothetical protein
MRQRLQSPQTACPGRESGPFASTQDACSSGAERQAARLAALLVATAPVHESGSAPSPAHLERPRTNEQRRRAVQRYWRAAHPWLVYVSESPTVGIAECSFSSDPRACPRSSTTSASTRCAACWRQRLRGSSKRTADSATTARFRRLRNPGRSGFRFATLPLFRGSGTAPASLSVRAVWRGSGGPATLAVAY